MASLRISSLAGRCSGHAHSLASGSVRPCDTSATLGFSLGTLSADVRGAHGIPRTGEAVPRTLNRYSGEIVVRSAASYRRSRWIKCRRRAHVWSCERTQLTPAVFFLYSGSSYEHGLSTRSSRGSMSAPCRGILFFFASTCTLRHKQKGDLLHNKAQVETQHR